MKAISTNVMPEPAINSKKAHKHAVVLIAHKFSKAANPIPCQKHRA
jgi:hypothetical protein